MVMVAPAAGSRLGSAPAYSLHVGGAESNVAMYAAALGHHTKWLSRVGNDPLGDFVMSEVAKAGVDVSGVDRDPNRATGVYFKDPTDDGTRVWYYRSDSAATVMDVATAGPLLGEPPLLLHLSGITPMLSANCNELAHYLVVDRPLENTVISFDVNHRPALSNRAEAPDVLRDLSNAADIVFVGLDEASVLWGSKTPDDVRNILSGPEQLIVKDGGREAVWFSSTETVIAPAPRVDVVEVVGAGDAFAAGWLSGWLRGLEPYDRLRLGHRLAGACLRSTSDYIELPSPETIREELDIPTSAWDGGLHRPLQLTED